MVTIGRKYWNVARAVVVMGMLGVGARAQVPAQAAGEKTQRLFWKITSPTTEVYFLGSIHVASKDMYPLPVEIEAAYSGASTLVVELDVTKVDVAAMTAKVQEQGMYPPGDSLEKHVSPETLLAFQKFCQDVGLPPKLLYTIKPPLLSTLIEESALEKMGMSADDGIDKHFLDAANKAKDKKIVELETADAQLKVLLGSDDKMNEKWLVDSLKETNKADLEKLIKAWKEGDVKTIEGLVLDDDKKDPDAAKMADLMIYQRNDEMTKKVAELLKGKDKALVVVGVAHLVGPKGVLKQLEGMGYKVERPELTVPPAAAKEPLVKPTGQ